MKLQFDYIRLQDFKSFTGEHIFDLEAVGYGLHFLCGKNDVNKRLGANGAGKSTLLDSLAWCLYGQTPNGLHNPDVQAWNGGKTFVETQIGLDDKTHIVRRSIAPNKLTFDDELIGQADLDAKLGLSSQLFLNTILLGQGQPLLFDLSPKAKMDLFSEVLSLDKWEDRALIASKETSRLQSFLDKKTGELNSLTSQLKELDRQIEAIQAKAQAWEDDRENASRNFEANLAQLRKESEACLTNKNKADLAYDAALLEAKHITDKIFEIEKQIDTVSKDLIKTKTDFTILSREIKSHEKEMEEMGDSCPTCGQSLKGTKLETHKQNLRVLIKAKKAALKAIVIPQKLFDDLSKKKTDLRFEEREYTSKALSVQDNLDYYVSRYAELEAQIKVFEKQQYDKEDEINPYQQQAKDLKKRKVEIIKRKKDDEDKHTKLTATLQRLKFWVQGFKDVRLFVIDEFLQELELTTNAMLPDVGLEDWQIKFASEKENKSGTIKRGINVEIYGPNNERMIKWESWSGGEAQRLRIVGALALSETLLNHAGVTTDLEILDEPLKSLSKEGVTDLIEFLNDRASRLQKQIVLVDHMAIESTKFASVVTVVKDAKGSFIK